MAESVMHRHKRWIRQLWFKINKQNRYAFACLDGIHLLEHQQVGRKPL